MKRLFLIFILFKSFSIDLDGQANFISSYPQASVLNSLELEQFQRYQALPQYSSIVLIQHNNLTNSINESGNLQIDIAGDECLSIEFEPQNSRFVTDQDYYYYGNLKDPNTDPNVCICECIDGEIMIESKNGRRYGYITIDDSRYEILGLGQAYSALAKINNGYFENFEECIVTAIQQGEGIKKSDTKLNARTGGCVIRVLFLFSQAAENAFGLNGVIDRANLAIAQTNQAFTNSAINNACVVNANIREYVGFTETPNNFNTDLFNQLIPDQQVANWRTEDLADVVILISNGAYGGILGGVPAINVGNPLEPWAYGIIQGNSITANFTFSHELGHIIGCDHQTCTQFQNNGCSNLTGQFIHGFAWDHRPCWLCSRKFHSSILHQLNTSRRELHYSNPSVNHHGQATGAATRDNARWIRDGNACHIAAYNPNPIIPLTVSISGDEILCKPLSGEYFVDANGSNSPFLYEWHISTDGANWGNSVGNGQSIWVNSNNYPLKSKVFLRVRVQDSSGNVVFAFFAISIRQKGTPGCNLQLLSNGGSGIKVYPNPTQRDLLVEFYIPEDNTETKMELHDYMGKLISRTFKKYPQGIQSEILNVDNLANGLLLFKVKIKDEIHNIIISKNE